MFERVGEKVVYMFEKSLAFGLIRMYVRNTASYPVLPAERRIRKPSGEENTMSTAILSPAHISPVHISPALIRPALIRPTNSRSVRTIARPSKSTAAPAAHLKLTRRGRLVLTLLITVPLIGGAFAMAINGGSATATDHSVVAPLHYATVSSGETLWQLAAQISPTSDPRDVVADIAQLNQLSTGDIQAGQRLAIPAKYGPFQQNTGT